MFTLFLSFVRCLGETDKCAAYNSSCLLCMQHNTECFYCHNAKSSLNKCVSLEHYNNETCVHKTNTTDSQCVQLLGGDAVPLTRYIIGTVILVAGLTIDIIVRFCSGTKHRDEYAHL